MDFEKVADMYLNERKSVPTISAELGIGYGRIYYALEKHGIKRRSNKENSRKFVTDDDFFSRWNEHSAYWLGFIMADGHVSSSGGKRVVLTSKDVEHLELFVSDTSSTYLVKEYRAVTSYGPTSYGRVSIASDKMYDDLVALGCVERKSKRLEPPIGIPVEMERFWIRGFFDGDGSLAKSKATRSRYRLALVGTKSVIDYVGFRLGGSIWYDKNKDVWYLDKSPTLDDLEYLYGNSNRHLQRKFDRAMVAKSRLSEVVRTS